MNAYNNLMNVALRLKTAQNMSWKMEILDLLRFTPTCTFYLFYLFIYFNAEELEPTQARNWDSESRLSKHLEQQYGSGVYSFLFQFLFFSFCIVTE